MLARRLALALVLTHTVAPAASALVQPTSRAMLEDAADAIVVAVVGPPRVVDESGRLDLFTRHPLRVERTIAGDLTDGDLVVVTEGGVIGDVTVTLEDEAVLVEGTRVALFLGHDEAGRLRVVGGARGVVPIAHDDDVARLVASLDDDTPVRPVSTLPTVRPLFETNGVAWGGEAPVAEDFRLHLAGFADIIDAPLVEDRFRAALAVWGREGGAPVRLTYGGPIDNDDFGGGDNDENTTHGGASILLFRSLAAARTTTVGGVIVDCDIRMYDRNRSGAIDWTANPDGAADGENDIEHTFIHELGHCLGLSHSDVEDAIMFDTNTTGTGDERRHLHEDDIAGLQSLYGIGSLPGEGEGEGEDIGEGEGEGGDDDDEADGSAPGGCAAGGSPGLMVVALLALRRRRR